MSLSAIMKTIVSAFPVALLIAAVVLASVTQSSASTDGKTRAFVYTNNTSNQYAWVSAYGSEQTIKEDIVKDGAKVVSAIGTTLNIGGTISTDTVQGAWCVAPGALDKHGLTAVIHTIRIELKDNCSADYKEVFNQTIAFDGQDLSGHPTSDAKPGITTITGGPKTSGSQHDVPGGGQTNLKGPGGPSQATVMIPYAIAETQGASQ
jgi:hypothetical protein